MARAAKATMVWICIVMEGRGGMAMVFAILLIM